MEEMKPEETRYDCPVYRMEKEKDGWSRLKEWLYQQ